MRKIIIILWIMLLSGASFAQTFHQGLKLSAGEKFQITSMTKGTTTQWVMGQQLEVPMESEGYETVEVTEKLENGFRLSSTVTRINFQTSVLGQDTKYDSDKPEDRNGKLGETMNSQVGAAKTFEIDQFGAVVKAPEAKPEANNMLDGMLANVGMSTGSGPVFDLFSETKEIKIGESFTDNKVIAGALSGTMATTYTLVSITDGVARFTYTARGQTSGKITMQGMEMTTMSNTQTSGEMLVAVETGVLMKRTAKVEFGGRITIQDMEIPIAGVMNVEITVSPVEA